MCPALRTGRLRATPRTFAWVTLAAFVHPAETPRSCTLRKRGDMRWFRRRGGGPSELDAARQEELLREVRRFGADARVRPADDVAALAPLLTEPDGLAVAARIVQEVAGEAFAGV